MVRRPSHHLLFNNSVAATILILLEQALRPGRLDRQRIAEQVGRPSPRVQREQAERDHAPFKYLERLRHGERKPKLRGWRPWI